MLLDDQQERERDGRKRERNDTITVVSFLCFNLTVIKDHSLVKWFTTKKLERERGGGDRERESGFSEFSRN